MRGLISFHPFDTHILENLIDPLLSGEKVNPEDYLERALRVRGNRWRSWLYKLSLEYHIEELEPPPTPEEGTLWNKVRARLERFDHRADAVSVLIGEKVEPELHLYGRPFLIAEGSGERVVDVCDNYLDAVDDETVDGLIRMQLARLDRKIAAVQPADRGGLSAPLTYRAELLDELRAIFEIGKASRSGGAWIPPRGERTSGAELMVRELPWRAVRLHGHVAPFWIGRDVDGLATVCTAAGVELPDFIVPGRSIFDRACGDLPGWKESLRIELEGEREIGAFVSAADVPELLSFLSTEGARIIRVATRHGEGPMCSVLLRKVRECARYAERHNLAYLEASGIRPLDVEEEPDGMF